MRKIKFQLMSKPNSQIFHSTKHCLPWLPRISIQELLKDKHCLLVTAPGYPVGGNDDAGAMETTTGG